ncbi:integrase core domain-containing protein [Cereibacter azotoformans]|uniref:integrase core domain-containing protein n=1 Tax=Cereibacter azotoformans TaxID=43057 RepID=UPI002467AE12|nr:integrase core domain-containing protein [Cereibacter azotoformans]
MGHGPVAAPWLTLHQPQVQGPGAQLRPEAGVHHPALPQQNGMVERVIRSLKEQCVHRQRFESLQHAARAIGDWIAFYNAVA